MNFDLPTPPHGYKTDLALIIAPYFDVNWFDRVARLEPRRMRILVDDSARTKDVEDLTKKYPAAKVALGSVKGILHLKGYYFEFIKAKGAGRPKMRFVFGSANATEAAFNGFTNAELIADTDISDETSSELVGYLLEVLAVVERGGGVVARREANSVGVVQHLSLPSFRVKQPMLLPEFDAWIQRGRLAAKYADPQQFMKIAVKLKKPLPQDNVARQFQRAGLIPQGSRDIVRYSYMEQSETKDDEKTPQWKAAYCIWTHLGYWLSENCYDELTKNNALKSKASEEREDRIDS
ncbi:MAG: hypothetical protein ABSA49_14900, partial [Rhizomicrobium sp.]